MTAKSHVPLKLIESPDRETQVVFETPHELTRPSGAVVIAIEPNDPTDDVGTHACGNCGEALILGPVEGRLDSGIVIQCPVCRAYNKATD
jgi:hypothetical protein